MSATPASKTPRYMCAYYHTFTPTGADTVDAILEAIAHAGKSYHSTDQWDEPNCVAKDGYWQMIQERAKAAAESHTALVSALEAQEEADKFADDLVEYLSDPGCDLDEYEGRELALFEAREKARALRTAALAKL